MPALTVYPSSDIYSYDYVKESHHHSIFDSRYNCEIIENDNIAISKVHYPNYPFHKLVFPKYSTEVYIEGVVYNRTKSDLERDIKRILTDQFRKETIADLLLQYDGEFVMYFLNNSTNSMKILTDVLGQLPLFYVDEGIEGWIVGRQKASIARMIGESQIDRMAAAQFLRLGFVLPYRTLYQRIKRVPEASIIDIDSGNGINEIIQYHKFDFSSETFECENDSINILAEKFAKACGRRGKKSPGKNIILLSGGMDSRGVLAGFYASNIDHVAATRKSEYDHNLDTLIASQIAEEIGTKWYQISINRPNIRDYKYHLEMTSGSDPLNIAHIQPFLRNVRNQVSSEAWTYTGDGGAFLGSSYLPKPGKNDVIDHCMNVYRKFSPKTVQKLTSISEHEIRTEVKKLISQYPESTQNARFKHFKLLGRAFSCKFQATDTNRNHLWTTTPYYAPEVILRSMYGNQTKTNDHTNFIDLLNNLCPEIVDYPNPSLGISPLSNTYNYRVRFYKLLQKHPSVLEIIKPIFKWLLDYEDPNVTSRDIELMQYQLKRNKQTSIIFSHLDDSEVLQELSSDRNKFLHILTLTSLIDSQNEPSILSQ